MLVEQISRPSDICRHFGLKPEMMHTACYRRFYATYQLAMDSITLKELRVRDKNGQYPIIEGVEPRMDERGSIAIYRDLEYPIRFTGKIRLARDFIQELYIHMGYQKASAFREVLDITTDEGRIVGVNDRSDEIKQIRGGFKQRYESGSIIDRIDDAFRLDLEIE